LRKVAHGETLFRAGDRFDSVFEIWTGFFKTVIATSQGREQVTGFQMGGELMGLDGIDTACTASTRSRSRTRRSA
jgi:CRP/FNR family transcriptional regulator